VRRRAPLILPSPSEVGEGAPKGRKRLPNAPTSVSSFLAMIMTVPSCGGTGLAAASEDDGPVVSSRPHARALSAGGDELPGSGMIRTAGIAETPQFLSQRRLARAMAVSSTFPQSRIIAMADRRNIRAELAGR